MVCVEWETLPQPTWPNVNKPLFPPCVRYCVLRSPTTRHYTIGHTMGAAISHSPQRVGLLPKNVKGKVLLCRKLEAGRGRPGVLVRWAALDFVGSCVSLPPNPKFFQAKHPHRIPPSIVGRPLPAPGKHLDPPFPFRAKTSHCWARQEF